MRNLMSLTFTSSRERSLKDLYTKKHIKWMLLQPEELEAMENVLPEKYEQARGDKKLRSQREDLSDMVAEVVCASQNEKKRKHKMPYMRDLSSIKFCKKPSRLPVTVTRIAGSEQYQTTFRDGCRHVGQGVF